ncbi:MULTISPECIES: phospho-sugar mutase [Pasteurellaceae]|uniref:Phospho-sugar mutase n=1 Tax=Pasteurella atlantica TaxID=2827233 RepID=A0AAW8CKG2_9PAST|nr:phospho-sugar mutase [Pasteurella atlantica]MBR0572725.1 phospho-sugar mutase [Pasteurella atlantica]MDP8038670.1 phospho-sugar mutase [Pasteurella atlantica]MDP8040762.1 phospho-sugar mutase [Pasteurella atlantica]MDP8042897.1 phospho-sugar mutase [Pasteurella atlantica]MDP8044984.1 phospho-sugar mutase [Pasteurella atlantica]
MKDFMSIAQQWLAQDPDAETRAELQEIIDQNDVKELEARFSDRLQFGTAGLRGRLQAGSMGMNRVLVCQAAAGLARFLLKKEKNPTIVIGYDGRKNSLRFAQDTAEIMQAAGIEAQLMPSLRPTPVLAFSVRRLKASAGVMVTASHNPPEDNGYKVYLGGEDDGAQIISPNDKLIAEEIQWVADNQRVNDIPRDTNYKMIDQAIIDEFIERTAKLATAPATDLSYVYTAMHGVGKETLLSVLEKAGLAKPTLVAEQCEPDGTFPTVAFPNPEEKGALDLAIEKAKEVNAEFIVANDPDADRLAVAVADENGQWATLHGNELGLYLGWFIAQQAQAEGKKGVLACSLVSSPLLGNIAKACGMEYQETLTGFKFIGRIPGLIFGFEEALGYLVNPTEAHDKDGISAITCFLNLINSLKAQGKTFAQYRQEFMEKFGAANSDQLSIRVEDLSRIQRIQQAVRANPFKELGGVAVEQYIDHLQTEKQNDILVFHLAGGQRVIFRPSGTEPKIKMYLDTTGKSLVEAKEICANIKADLAAFADSVA